MRWDDFELRIRAVFRLLIRSPSPKMRSMSKPISLHVLVSDFNHELGAQWFP